MNQNGTGRHVIFAALLAGLSGCGGGQTAGQSGATTTPSSEPTSEPSVRTTRTAEGEPECICSVFAEENETRPICEVVQPGRMDCPVEGPLPPPDCTA